MRRLVIVCALILSFVTLSFAIAPADNGKWIAAGSLMAARQGAAAVVLPDGRVLVTGGRGADGSVLASTEIIQAGGSVTAGAAMSAPRAGHTATMLSNGSVLIAGGDSGAGATVTAEVFDPNTNVFTQLSATLSDARTGHVAVLDAKGNVIIIGGTTASGPVMSVELFNATTQQFGSVGRMMYPRSQAAIAAFKDGRVLIAGGVDADGTTLASTEIFDPSTGASIAGPAMNVPRAGASATLQIDGNIIVIGGTTPGAQGTAAELASGELFTADGSITPIVTVLNVARTGHTAFLLPENAGVLVVGGQAAGTDLNSAELYEPWTGKATLSTMAATHAGGAGAAKPGVMTVAGGANQFGIDLFGFPTIKTDFADYAPGEPVWMTGTGWLPQETVNLYMLAIPSTANVAPTITTIADQNGRISDGDWAPDTTDIGARFYLTAVGTTSGWQAQTTFTDGALTVTVTGSGSVTGTSPALSPTPCTSANSPCTAAGSSNFNDPFTASQPAAWTCAGNASCTCATGSTSCTVTGALNGTSRNGTLAVSFAVSLTSISPNSGTYGQTATTLTATGTNFANGYTVINFNGTDLTTTCSSSTTCTASIFVDKTNAGNIPVYVHNGANTSATRTFTLSKRAITVTAVSCTKTYDGTTTSPLTPDVPALQWADTSNFIQSFDNKNVGSNHVMTASGTVNDGNGGNNYTVTFQSVTGGQIYKKSLATGISVPSSKVYDGTTSAVINGTAALQAAEAVGTGSSGDGKPYTIDSVTLSGTPTATYNSKDVTTAAWVSFGGLSLTGTGSGNYDLLPYSQVATITPKSLTVSGVSASNKTYDGTTAAAINTSAASLAGVVSGDTVNLVATGSVGTFSDKNVGSGKPVQIAGLTLSGSSSGNYTVTQPTATATISPLPITASITAQDKNYDASASVVITNCVLSGVLSADNGNVSCSIGSASFASASTGLNKTVTATGISLTGSAAGNYSLSTTTATTTANINALTVTPSVTAQTKTYDGTTTATIANCSLSGVLSGDTSNVGCSATGASFSDPNVGSNKTVTVTSITLTGSAAGNYQLSATTATTSGVIGQLQVNASISASNKIYDTTTNATVSNCQLSGVLVGDTGNVACSGTGAYFNSRYVGTNRLVTATVALNGPAAGNYVLGVNSASTYANITPAPVTASISVQDKYYDANVGAELASCNLSGVFSSDLSDVTCFSTSTVFNDPNVGNLKPVTASLGIYGNLADDYYLTSTTATGTASIRALQVTAHINAQNKTYDGTSIAAVTGCFLTSAVSGDSVGCQASSASFDTANSGNGKLVTASSVTLTGASASNYLLSAPVAYGNANIAPAPATATAGSYTGVYDGVAHSLSSCAVTGAYTVGLSCANNPTAVGPGAGSGSVTAIVSGPTTNFIITPVDGLYSISQAPANIVITDLTKTYDGSPKAPSIAALTTNLLVTYTGIAPTDYPATAIPPTNPGSYTVTATAVDANYFGTQTATLVINAASTNLSLAIVSGMSSPTVYGSMVAYELVMPTFPCPTGQVQFYLDGSAVGSPIALPTSNCTQPVKFQSATLPVGVHPLYAIYSGDSLYQPQTSNTVQHTVNANGTSVTLSTSSNTVNVGQSVTFTATVSPTTTLDGAAQPPSGAVQFLDNDVVIGSGALSTNAPYVATYTTTTLAVSSHNIKASYTSPDGLYTGSSSGVTVETVNLLTPEITWQPSTTSLTYGDKITAEILNATAALEGNTVPGHFTYNVSVGDVLAAGQQNITATFHPDDTATYGAPTQSVTITVAKATLTVTADDQSRAYGAGNPSFTYHVTGLVNAETNSVVSGLPSLTTAADPTSPVGKYAIAVDAGTLAADNYTFNYVAGNLTVNPVTLTVTADSKSKNAGDANPTLTASFSGFVNGDTASMLSGSPAVTTTATTNSPMGTYPITVTIGTLAATNYTFTFVPGTLTVNKAAIMLTWPTPAAINSNVPLSATQLNATASVPGTFTYNPQAGTFLSAGNQTLSVTFTPTDLTKYSAVSTSVTLVVYQYKGIATAPVLNPPNGTFNNQTQTVTISNTSGAAIYYTTDGSIPTTNSRLYTAPVIVTKTMVIRAIAAGNGYDPSSGVAGTYYVVATAPVLSPASGTFNDKTHTVTITGGSGAPIYYTTDGSIPTTSSRLYTAPITVTNTMIIRAIAVGNGFDASSGAVGTYNVVATAPVLSPASGTFNDKTHTVTITVGSGAPIYYTTDGSIPTTSSRLYTAPITVTNTMIIRAIAAGNGFDASSGAVGTYNVVATAPVLSPASGTFNDKVHTVSITGMSGVPIYYTIDGSIPTTSSTPYTAPIIVTNSMIIRAIAAGNGYDASSGATGTYKVVASTPVLSPAGGTFKGSQQVSMSDASGVPIYYTTDGSIPTTSSTPYTGAITVTKSMTIRAIAGGSGYDASSGATGVFTIK